MQFKSKLLASAVAFGTMIAAGAEAAQPPALDTYVLGGLRRETTAKFQAGATINDGASFLKTVPAGVPVDLMTTITIERVLGEPAGESRGPGCPPRSRRAEYRA